MKKGKSEGIYIRGSTYWIRYSINGKQYRESTGSDKKEVAKLLLAKRLQERSEGIIPIKASNITFNDLAERYLAWVNGRQACYKVRRAIVGQLLSVFNDMPLKSITVDKIEQLQTELINKGYKHSTNNNIIAVIKRMFSKAYEWDLIPDEVLRRVRKVKPLRTDSGRLRYLSIEEIKTLLNHCPDYLRPVVITALNTGMRKSEILGLRWDKHIDLRHNTILLDKTKNSERREIPINQTLRETLTSIQRRLDIPYVFFDPATGRPYKDLNRGFDRACKRAGIHDFHFHDLRHTFASQLVMAGVDITTVSKLLGHKSLKMTLRYSHLSQEHLDKAIKKLDTLIGQDTISTKLAQSGV